MKPIYKEMLVWSHSEKGLEDCTWLEPYKEVEVQDD